MDEKFKPSLSNTVSAIEKQSTKSVMSPMLWLTGIILIPTVPAACITSGWVQGVFLTILVMTIAMALASNIYWSFADPDRLQSEEFVVKKLELQTIGDDRSKGKTIEHSAQPTPNTYMQASTTGGHDGN